MAAFDFEDRRNKMPVDPDYMRNVNALIKELTSQNREMWARGYNSGASEVERLKAEIASLKEELVSIQKLLS